MSASSTTSEPAAPRIVKAHAIDAIGRPQAFNYQDLQLACEDYLESVREQSRRIITASTADADALRKKAIEEGHRQGYQAGLKAAEADTATRVERLAAERLKGHLETVLPAVRHLADRLQSDREHWLAHWEGNAIRLAVAVAEKLIRKTLVIDPAAADSLISETLKMAAGSTQLTVRMSAVDLDRIGESVKTLNDAVGRLGEANFVADPAVSPGGCIVDTRYGRLDGRIEVMLERIASELVSEESNDSASAAKFASGDFPATGEIFRNSDPLN